MKSRAEQRKGASLRTAFKNIMYVCYPMDNALLPSKINKNIHQFDGEDSSNRNVCYVKNGVTRIHIHCVQSSC